MVLVPIHKEFHLRAPPPALTWVKRTPSATGARIGFWWLYLALRRANKLGLTLGGAGLATAEATAAAALTVCDADPDGIFVTADYGRLKDFVKPFLSGTLGAGLTLLQMAAAGYDWMAHWEDCGGPTASAHPDFVCFRHASAHAAAAVCLVESKGSRGPVSDADVQADWTRQIWPNRHQRVTLPGGRYLWPTEGRLVANELPGPDGRKRFRSTVVHGEFPGGLATAAPALPVSLHDRLGWAAAGAPDWLRPDTDGAAIDWWRVQRASLRHVCRLLDLPATEAEFKVSLWDDPGSSARQHQIIRAFDELDHRRIELDWGPNGGRDAACAGRPQHVVRPDGTRWDVTLYCQYEVLSSVLWGDPARVADGAERHQAEWGGLGQQNIRLQGPDGFGLLAQQRSEAPPERG